MRIISIGALFLLFSAHSSFAADAPAKESVCRACHGKNGAAPIADNYPTLAGQNKGYLVLSMKAYKEGKRTGGLAAAMTAQVKSLSDADINALAAFYAAQKLK